MTETTGPFWNYAFVFHRVFVLQSGESRSPLKDQTHNLSSLRVGSFYWCNRNAVVDIFPSERPDARVRFAGSNSDETSHLPSLLLRHLAAVEVSQADIFSHAGCSRLRRVRGTGVRLAPPPRRRALLTDGGPDRRSDKRGSGLRRWMGARG